MGYGSNLRAGLVAITRLWEDHFGVAPNITCPISEYDAAMLVGVNEDTLCIEGRGRTAVSKDFDFTFQGLRYQVTANRPSGKPGSPVTRVSQKYEDKRPFGWDILIWILYDREYQMQEAWMFTAEEYRRQFSALKRLSPQHMRLGQRIYP